MSDSIEADAVVLGDGDRGGSGCDHIFDRGLRVGDLAGARVANIGIHHRHGQHPRHDRGLHTRRLRLVD